VYVSVRGRTERALENWTREEKRRDLFIAKTLFKTLRKLLPLQISDSVRRIPLPLQTLPYGNTRPVAAKNPCIIQCTTHYTADEATSSLLCNN
jgi:hypothetical protein